MSGPAAPYGDPSVCLNFSLSVFTNPTYHIYSNISNHIMGKVMPAVHNNKEERIHKLLEDNNNSTRRSKSINNGQRIMQRFV
jgi:hypothetical protein